MNFTPVRGSPGREAELDQSLAIGRVTSSGVEFYLYPTVGTVLIHSVKPELTE